MANTTFIVVIDRAYVNYIIMGSVLVIHLFDCWLFICYFDLGMLGGALAEIITCFLNSVISLFYIFVIKPLPEAAIAPSMKSVHGLWRYFVFTAPIILILCSTNWGLEILNVIAMSLPPLQYSAYAITFSSCFFAKVFNSGLVSGCAILIARNLGAGNIRVSRKLIWICISFGLMLGVVILAVYIPLRYVLLNLFTNNHEIYELAVNYSLYFLVLGFPFIMSMTLLGIFRGLGKQIIGAILAMLNMYVINVGTTCILVFVYNMGAYGIYWGIFCGCMFDIFIYSLFLFSYDFRILKLEAITRVIRESHGIGPTAEDLSAFEDDEENEKLVNQKISDDETTSVENLAIKVI